MQEEAPRWSAAIQRVYAWQRRDLLSRGFKRMVHECNVRLGRWFSYSMLEIFRKPEAKSC